VVWTSGALEFIAPANYVTVIAAVVYGAVRRSPSESYSIKDGRNYTGTAPRSPEQLAGLDQYADILRDYCNHGDPICAVGSEPVDVGQHMNYFESYDEEVMDFIVRVAHGEEVEMDQEKGTRTKAAQSSASPTPTPVESGSGQEKLDEQEGQTEQMGAAVGLTIGTTVGFGAALGAVFMLL
jgi:acetylxylan esterase